MNDWDRYPGINTRLAAPVLNFALGDHHSRKKTRTMGPVSRMAVHATERALVDAALIHDPIITSGRCGIAYGSSFGSYAPVLAVAEVMNNGTSNTLNATSYIQMMGHTAAVNIGLAFGVTGRIIPTSTACTAGSMAIGYAYEAIRWGKADVMIAGGADELNVAVSAVFDTMVATSVRNDRPEITPRPFDRDRDGLVIGEGAATLILEDRERAVARGAHITAEIVGFACNSDGTHATLPEAGKIEIALRMALDDASLAPAAIGFVSGHATGTEWGDIAETKATNAVFGERAPIHSLKSYFGHSLGASGAIEAWLGIEMMHDGSFVPTINLDAVDDRCAALDYIMGEPRRIETEYLMSNNFAFGGINTSLIFRRV
jgi:3-oxoacyl-[acyl-carrier-protein] synthase II